MWEKFIEYLKDPLLVVKVQNFFGVIYKRNVTPIDEEPLKSKEEVIHSDLVERLSDENDLRRHQRYPSDLSSSSQSSCETDSSADRGTEEEIVCMINNKFWYYLFVLGTALGDELFYTTFIPFWFWNIDGAVGRRVVLVWTVVMYIGNIFRYLKNNF